MLECEIDCLWVCLLCLPTQFWITNPFQLVFAVIVQLYSCLPQASSCSQIFFRDTNGNWSWWPSWRPTSMSLLKTAEAKILACKSHPFGDTLIAQSPVREHFTDTQTTNMPRAQPTVSLGLCVITAVDKRSYIFCVVHMSFLHNSFESQNCHK